MMKYWPLSVVADNPLMNPMYVPELWNAHSRMLSHEAMIAAAEVARHLPQDLTPLVIIESNCAPTRLAYTAIPSLDDFRRLERAAFYECSAGFGFRTEPLH